VVRLDGLGPESVEAVSLTEVVLAAARVVQGSGSPVFTHDDLTEALPEGLEPETCDAEEWRWAARDLGAHRLVDGHLRRSNAGVVAELELSAVEGGEILARQTAVAPSAAELLGPLGEAARTLLGGTQTPTLGAWCSLPPPPVPRGSVLELPLTPVVVQRPAASELEVTGSPAGARLDIWGPPAFNGGQPLATTLPLSPPIVVPPGRYEVRVSHPDHVAWRGSQVIPSYGVWAPAATLLPDVGTLLVAGAPLGLPFVLECRDSFRREGALPGPDAPPLRVPVPRGSCTARTAPRLGWIAEPRVLEVPGGGEVLLDLSPTQATAEQLARQADPAGMVRWGLAFKPVPGGSFLMGSSTGALDERPKHEVRVADFEILRTEVTVAMYRACVEAGHPGCAAPTRCSWGKPNYEAAGSGEHPVVCVDWEMARAFAAWVGDGAALCTEAQWEYAARSGGKEQAYPWGDAPATCGRANTNTPDGAGCEQGNATLPACATPGGHSQHGVCDLAGNVWEWVQDCYEPGYEGAPGDGSARTQCSSAVRVRRGGSWYLQAGHARATRRDGRPPASAHPDTGFRLCRPRQP